LLWVSVLFYLQTNGAPLGGLFQLQSSKTDFGQECNGSLLFKASLELEIKKSR